MKFHWVEIKLLMLYNINIFEDDYNEIEIVSSYLINKPS